MELIGVVGQSRSLDPREAGSQVARQALDQLGRNTAVAGFVFASVHLPMQQVISGISALLGDLPIGGCSTLAEISAEGKAE